MHVGNEVAPSEGDSFQASSAFQFSDLPAGMYTYCAPGALFSSGTTELEPYPFPLCDASITGPAMYSEEGAYAIIQGARGTQVTAEITSFDVPCQDMLFTSPLASGPSPLEQCGDTAGTTTLVAKSRTLRVQIRDATNANDIPSGGGICMDVTIA